MGSGVGGFKKGIEGPDGGVDGAVVGGGGGDPVDEAVAVMISELRSSTARLRRIGCDDATYLFGFFGGAPSTGFSAFAWTTLTARVAGSFSNEVAVIGKGALRRPTVFPGARRK